MANELDKGTLKEPPSGWIRPGDAAEGGGGDESGSSGEHCVSFAAAVQHCVQLVDMRKIRGDEFEQVCAHFAGACAANIGVCHACNGDTCVFVDVLLQMRMMTTAMPRMSMVTSPSMTTAMRTWQMLHQARAPLMSCSQPTHSLSAWEPATGEQEPEVIMQRWLR